MSQRLVKLIFVCIAGCMGMPQYAAAQCSNEALRVGASAGLPDCRAYELVTPADKGRTQDLTFSGGDFAAVAGNGEALALEATVPFGPNPSPNGSHAIFSRTQTGWEMKSAAAPGASGEQTSMKLLSPNLLQVALQTGNIKNLVEASPDVTLEAGPVGGSYARVDIPREDVENAGTNWLGASSDFGDVVFESRDHDLLGTATGTDEQANDLYDLVGEQLQLVNVTTEGELVNKCGATLGAGPAGGTTFIDTTANAVSKNGSTIFFTSPAFAHTPPEPACNEPESLYMRANGITTKVSAPEGVEPSTTFPARYDYATPNGSKVFFNTTTVLTPGETAEEKSANKLFEYDAEAPTGRRLTLIASDVLPVLGQTPEAFIFSEDGSVIYFFPGGEGLITRYDTITGVSTPVAGTVGSHASGEPAYSTPNGEFFLFTSRGVEGEPRGQHPPERYGPNELYRYDAADGSVMCVSCGTGNAPAKGDVVDPAAALAGVDGVPQMTQITASGQEVFFQTTARLTPQDTNSTEATKLDGFGPGLDVYEWETVGSGDCELTQGCTYLLSSGETSGPSTFLGASANGSDVFFVTPTRLAPQDDDEFDDIYDAREDGGFALPPIVAECTSCQGVGSPPPLFNVPASVEFMGAANPVTMGRMRHKPSKGKRRARRGSKRRTERTARLRGRSRRP